MPSRHGGAWRLRRRISGMRDGQVLWAVVMGLFPLLVTLHTNLRMGFELWVRIVVTGKKDSELDVDSLVYGQTTCLSFQGFFLFIGSLHFMSRGACLRKVRRAHLWQCLPCPVLTQRSPGRSLTWAVHLPYAFHCSSTSAPAGTWERRRNKCLFSVASCAKV